MISMYGVVWVVIPMYSVVRIVILMHGGVWIFISLYSVVWVVVFIHGGIPRICWGCSDMSVMKKLMENPTFGPIGWQAGETWAMSGISTGPSPGYS